MELQLQMVGFTNLNNRLANNCDASCTFSLGVGSKFTCISHNPLPTCSPGYFPTSSGCLSIKFDYQANS